jgi:hypothetical protein
VETVDVTEVGIKVMGIRINPVVQAPENQEDVDIKFRNVKKFCNAEKGILRD